MIALVIIAVAILAMTVTTTTISATTIGIGNITDGKPRIALIQEEDFSFSLFQTINGTTIQIAGFDNLLEAVDYFNNEILQLEELELEPEEEIEDISEEEDSDNGGGDDNSGSDNGDDNDNGDEPEPEEPELPIEPILPPVEEGGETEGAAEEFGIITDGCFGGGYYEDGPKICYPIDDDGELETEPPKDTAFCAALGCLFNPPNL